MTRDACTTGWPGNPALREYNEVSVSHDELASRLANGQQVMLGDPGHAETVWYRQDAALPVVVPQG